MNRYYCGLYRMSLLVFWHRYIRAISQVTITDDDLRFAVKVRNVMTDEDVCYLTGCIDSGLL